jgi:hypothetical protein
MNREIYTQRIFLYDQVELHIFTAPTTQSIAALDSFGNISSLSFPSEMVSNSKKLDFIIYLLNK